MTGLPSDKWGVLPYVSVAGWTVAVYPLALALAFVAGGALYLRSARKAGVNGERTAYLLFAALLGAAIGAKIPIWALRYRDLPAMFQTPQLLLTGRTIVGALIGAAAAVVLARRRAGISLPSGNLFAAPVALGLAIGRLGCFARGCCYGVPTSLPWGVDFGDGFRRHPTQLYESAFGAGMFAYLLWAGRRSPRPGVLFKRLIVGYFIARFLIEFVRHEPRSLLGLTAAQTACVVAIVGYVLFDYLKLRSLLRTSAAVAEVGDSP